MARPRDHAKHISVAVEDLLRAVTGLLGSVQEALAEGRQVGRAAVEVKDVAARKGRKLKSALKAYWSRLSPKERRARIRKMHAWRRGRRRRGGRPRAAAR